MTPIKVIKSWHGETCSPTHCQPIHSPSSSPAHISAHLVPLHAIIRRATSLSCLPLIFLSWAPHSLSFMLQPSCALLLLLRPLKETWSLKSAKRSTPEALKRPSAQLIVTETATEGKERGPGPAGERGELNRESGCEPGPNEGRDNCFVLLGALLQRGGSWNDTAHMVFGWSGQKKRGEGCRHDARVVKV